MVCVYATEGSKSNFEVRLAQFDIRKCAFNSFAQNYSTLNCVCDGFHCNRFCEKIKFAMIVRGE